MLINRFSSISFSVDVFKGEIGCPLFLSSKDISESLNVVTHLSLSTNETSVLLQNENEKEFFSTRMILLEVHNRIVEELLTQQIETYFQGEKVVKVNSTIVGKNRFN